jgi:hypothetical protein
MKKLILVSILIFAIALISCKSSDSDKTAESIIDDDEPWIEQPVDNPEPIAEVPEATEDPPEIDIDTGGDDDWIQPPVQDKYVVLEGKAEAGPCNLLSQVGAMSVDDDWLMSGYVPGWVQDNDGLFMIRGTFTGAYRFFDFYGTCYSEGAGTDVDGFRLKMVQPATAEKHNINNATTLRFAVAQKHYTNPSDPFYNDIPGSFIQAKSEIYDFLGFPAATKNFYELSVVGDSTADAYLFKFELAMTKGRTGSEVGHYLGLMANAIISNDTAFRDAFIADVQDLLVKQPWDQLKAELVDRGFSTDPAPLWLTHPKAYYTDLMTRTPSVVESKNITAGGSCSIDVNTHNSFAYPVSFADLESARYFATELSGELSIWTVGLCDNGTTTFSCPGTQLMGIERLLEILLPDPADLSFNGELGNHGLISGQYYLVQHVTGSPSHTCDGNLAPFGRNIAAIDDDWNAAIGFDNTTNWFRRGIKWVTTD